MPKVKEELDRMEHMGVISRVHKPTEWCAGILWYQNKVAILEFVLI